ncbi:hypothetical protein SAMD00019534_026130 [Acytostelium subglobosum LB1]|uniref:hypothetical protein n=1 Tax=Acytostelium subglobosum LB1 TaxID=1410327 RepID=UPI000644B944|nr:hypothetical protein SAMD00019534_026130 [Acytostelium subglobosum LB1]GAM19438.1 hypothetical protein SAMD00019534_026130 [Acytostelium subglobosum LB1]|eukprot:XP_012757365.1 hypothetical protein SAMD00019534_026130 [Acytostelium subglobosum LB1]
MYNLPTTLTQLTFGDSFNQPIEPGSLPPKLISLTFGSHFDQVIIAGALPSTLKTLTLGIHFDQVIHPSTLPNSTLLMFNYCVKPIIAHSLPTLLTELTYGKRSQRPVPSSFQLLNPSSLPRSLTSLRLGGEFNQEMMDDVFPTNLRTLTFGSKFNQPIGFIRLLPNLTSLTFGNCFSQPLSKDCFPPSLKTLGLSFGRPLNPNTIPDSLTSLVLGNNITVNDGRDLNNVTNLAVSSQTHLNINVKGSSVKNLTTRYRLNSNRRGTRLLGTCPHLDTLLEWVDCLPADESGEERSWSTKIGMCPSNVTTYRLMVNSKKMIIHMRRIDSSHTLVIHSPMPNDIDANRHDHLVVDPPSLMPTQSGSLNVHFLRR